MFNKINSRVFIVALALACVQTMVGCETPLGHGTNECADSTSVDSVTVTTVTETTDSLVIVTIDPTTVTATITEGNEQE